MIKIASGLSNFFGLDIGTKAIRLVELKGSGAQKTLLKYAYAPIDSNLAFSDSEADKQKMAQAIDQLVKQAGITTKNVAVNLPSDKVFTTVADIDRLPEKESAQSIRYRAGDLIPTPLEQSKIDYIIVGDSPLDKTKQEILLSSVPNSYIESRLDMIESTGLNVIAFEPDSMALTRALINPDDKTPQLILDVGRHYTDLVVILGGVPRLTRGIPFGVEQIVKAAQQNMNIDLAQAEQFVFKFGMTANQIEGQVLNAIQSTVDMLADEIEKSRKFFEQRYENIKIEKMTITGGASTIPDMPVYLANKFTMNVEIGNAWHNVVYAKEREAELLALSSQFSVAVGLAERIE